MRFATNNKDRLKHSGALLFCLITFIKFREANRGKLFELAALL